ncbi:hypothetical protein LCGC14_0451040 [marine sediment metagenome]|uniref:Uncharacterized protein n=1 Tax=marine sediment metagenome TaxID=412755 RepID=A0A0F9VRS7_9ZZZZ
MSDYQYRAQGKSFLAKCKAKMTVRYLGYRPHFDDDKESRDVFGITFRRMRGSCSIAHRFGITFGQSTADSTGSGDNKPSAYAVLTCLTKRDPGTFEEFCAEYGYDTDSRKAEKTHKAVVAEWNQVKGFFTDDEITALAEIN